MKTKLKPPELPTPVEALRQIEKALRGRDSYWITMDARYWIQRGMKPKIGLGRWIKRVIRHAKKRKDHSVVHHKPEDCPYLHVRDCPGCGRSCACFPSKKKKQKKG